jgi:hypothetical protein
MPEGFILTQHIRKVRRMNLKKFFDLFFEDGDIINTSNKPSDFGKYVIKNSKTDSLYKYFFVNPLGGPAKGRRASNIVKFKNFVFEFDFGSIYEQGQRVKALGLPYSAMVFSGNKSLHVFVCLDKPISMKQFKLLANKTKTILGSDVNCIPWALGRFPSEDQPLIEIKSRISTTQLINWIDFNYEGAVKTEQGGNESEILEYICSYKCLPNNSHNMAVASGRYLKEKGVSKEDCLNILSEARINTTTKTEYEALEDVKKVVNWLYT